MCFGAYFNPKNIPIQTQKKNMEEGSLEGELSEWLAELKDSKASLQDYLELLDDCEDLKKQQSFGFGEHLYTGKYKHGSFEVVVEEDSNGNVRSCYIKLRPGDV